jgi:glycosyltransferase involved in cell wall biosynthesis
MLVPAGDPEALAASVAVYLHDPALARRHGRTARERAEREYSLDAMVKRYIAVYDDVLAETENQ